MKTAVEWLYEQILLTPLDIRSINKCLEQAKAMERDQIIDAHFTSSGCNSFDVATDRVNSAYKAAEQYYTYTYEQDKQG
jgi:hypothetical protein